MNDYCLLSAPPVSRPRPFTFADALAQVVRTARAQLPASLHGRLETALGLVEAHAVELPLDGAPALVHSRTRDGIVHTVAGSCSCEDAHFQAPEGLCAHRLAVGLSRKAGEVLQAALAPTVFQLDLDRPLPAPAPAVGEYPVSATVKGLFHGQDVMLTVRGQDVAQVQAQVEAASQWLDAPPQRPQPPPPGEGWCAVHQTQMRFNPDKGQGAWWSHKAADGWCKGK